MQLLLIRHGIAEEAEASAAAGVADHERPLTDAGRKKMRKGANRLRSQLNRLDLVACSQLRRARETAEIVSRAFGDIPLIERADLAPDAPLDELLAWLATPPTAGALALVGHDPQLSRLAGLLLAATPRPLISLKRGGMALINFPDPVQPGAGVLWWALTPGQLRSLKD
jgi:phosphohistidine phosphatase